MRHFAAVAVAEDLKSRRAAKRIHIYQSPPARAIRILENELGIIFLRRLPRRIELTTAVPKLLTESHNLLARPERFKREVRHTHVLHQAPLSIEVVGSESPSRCSASSSTSALGHESCRLRESRVRHHRIGLGRRASRQGSSRCETLALFVPRLLESSQPNALFLGAPASLR